VILCVKLWDAGEAIRPIVGPQTAVIPQQNGVDAHERLIPILGRKAVMGGTAWVTGSIIAPGVVRQTGTYQRLIFGELDGSMSRRGQALSDACAAAGFEGDFSANVLLPRNFSRSCRSRASIRSPACHWASIAKTPSCGGYAKRACARRPRSMPPHGMTSMCNDLLRGNRLELPWFAGKVVELGRRHGIPTPVCNLLYAALKPHMNGKPN